jgi:NADPH-dependent 2,4-dienoyl-CoA reductase/sulfur reductase-like enzyme
MPHHTLESAPAHDSRVPVIIIGAGLAGLRAAEGARRAGYSGPLVMIGHEAHPPYDRPPLSKDFITTPVPPDVTLRHPDELRDELQLDLRLGAGAEELDVVGKRVRVGREWLRYSAIVLACGHRSRTFHVDHPGQPLHPLRTMADALRLRQRIDDGAERVAILGAGFIGSELASSARARGVHVTLVSAVERPLADAIGEQASDALVRMHRANGVDVRLGCTIVGVGASSVVLSDGSEVAADLVAYGIGGEPETEWLIGSGLELDAGGVMCDAFLQAAPHVYAAGDIVSWPSEHFGRRLRSPHWTAASEQGTCAGHNAVAADKERFDTVPYSWSDVYGTRLQFVGIAAGSEMVVVHDELPDGGFLALARSGDQLSAACGIDMRRKIVAARRHIRQRTPWNEVIDELVSDPRSAMAATR